MLTYGIMVAGFAALLAMTYNALRHATPAEFLCRGILLATIWFVLCLAVLG